jgi:signal transduction histidine kinase
VQECVNLLAPVFEGRQIQLDNQIAGNSGCPVIADTKCLRQVLLNLMSNAVKYSRDGGHVLLHCEEDIHGRLRLGVTDAGPGIDPADQSHIFEPFSRLRKDTHVEGTGIGLTVSKQLVELMGGELTLDSRPGEGSTFWIELNRVETAPLTANG